MLENSLEFGSSLRSQFLLDDKYISLNHGSYGTYPKSVREALREFQDRSEFRPDQWMRRDLEIELTKARETIANFVNADTDEVVFIQNTTTGINAILKSLTYVEGDKLLFLSTVYNSVRELLYFTRDNNDGKVQLIELEVNYPITDEDLISKIEKCIEEEKQNPNSRIKLAVIDAISSTPGVVVPFQKIIQILRKHDIISVIDGAHAIGQIPLDLKEFDPDYFVTNCHKWLYTVRGSALLYVPFRNQKNIRHPIVSALCNSGFVKEFSWVGTQDFSSYLTIHPALAFRKKLGGEDKIQSYCRNLAIKGGKLIASILNTEILGPESSIAHMVNIRLPIKVDDGKPNIFESEFHELMFNKYNCYVMAFKHADKFYVRASAQVYTDLKDFEKVGYILKEICDSTSLTKYKL
nr:15440_t:CDS:2 [Entrophospora candida]